MSLILLFLSQNQIPPNVQNAFTPGVLQAIETLRPSLIFVETSTGVFTESTITYSSSSNTYNTGLYGGSEQSMPKAAVVFAIDTIKPTLYTFDTNKSVLEAVQEATGQFTNSTVTYSSSTDTYNSGLYGGSEQVRPKLMTLSSIDRF